MRPVSRVPALVRLIKRSTPVKSLAGTGLEPMKSFCRWTGLPLRCAMGGIVLFYTIIIAMFDPNEADDVFDIFDWIWNP